MLFREKKKELGGNNDENIDKFIKILYWNYTDWRQPKRVINPEPWGSEAQPNSTDKEMQWHYESDFV